MRDNSIDLTKYAKKIDKVSIDHPNHKAIFCGKEDEDNLFSQIWIDYPLEIISAIPERRRIRYNYNFDEKKYELDSKSLKMPKEEGLKETIMAATGASYKMALELEKYFIKMAAIGYI